jgi:hypothetical protein
LGAAPGKTCECGWRDAATCDRKELVAKQRSALAHIDGFLAAAVGALICLFCVMRLPAMRFGQAGDQ